MSSELFKIKHIVPLISVVLLAAAVGVGLLRWILTFGLGVEVIKEDMLDVFIPATLAVVIVWLALRKCFRIIREDDSKRADWRSLLQFITWGAMSAMMMLSQSYVMHRFSSLQRVDNIDQIGAHTPQRYYQIDKFSLRPFSMGSYVNNRTIGRSRTDLRFTAYVVFPFAQSSNAWYALRYSTTIRYGSDEQVDREFAVFLKDCDRKIAEHDFQRDHIFERVPPSDDRDGFLRAIEGQRDGTAVATSSDAVILRPMSDGYVDKSDQRLKWVFLTFGIWLLLISILLKFAPINDKILTKKLTQRKTKTSTSDNSGEFFRLILIPNGSNWSTALIIDVILLYFVVMTFGGVNPLTASSQELFEWGALRGGSLADGEWWRIITSMFMHANAMHLFGNLVALGLAIFFAVNLFGLHRVAIIFLLTGICAGTTAALLFEGTYVGSSGAVMGLTGAVFAIYAIQWRSIVEQTGIDLGMLLWLVLMAALTLLMGISSGISNTAHITGLITGAIMGVMLFRPITPKRRKQSNKVSPTSQVVPSVSEDLPELEGEHIVIKKSIGRTISILVLMAVMTAAAIGYTTIAKDTTEFVMGIIGCLFFGGGVVMFVLDMIINGVAIVITPVGFEYRVSFYKRLFVSWSNVESIHKLTIHTNDIISVTLKERAKFDAQLNRFHRWIPKTLNSQPSVQIMVETAQKCPEEIIYIMNEHLQRYNQALKSTK